MKQKSLLVSDLNGKHITVTGTEQQIQTFLKWVAEYNRGYYNVQENIVTCEKPNDLRSCRLRAIRTGLCKTVLT